MMAPVFVIDWYQTSSDTLSLLQPHFDVVQSDGCVVASPGTILFEHRIEASTS